MVLFVNLFLLKTNHACGMSSSTNLFSQIKINSMLLNTIFHEQLIKKKTQKKLLILMDNFNFSLEK